jgi:hypothetical protein
MFEINSLTPQPIPTKFCVATIQNPARNIGYIRIQLFNPLTDSNQIWCSDYKIKSLTP